MRIQDIPVDKNGKNGSITGLKSPPCGKRYRRQAWLAKHLKIHNCVEARQSLVSSLTFISDRVHPHMSHAEPMIGHYQEPIEIRTVLALQT